MQTFTERYYIKEARMSNIQNMFLRGFGAVSFIVLLVVAGLYFVRLKDSKLVTPTCGSFSSYSEALKSYQDGNTALDGNKDGIPCNSLFYARTS